MNKKNVIVISSKNKVSRFSPLREYLLHLKNTIEAQNLITKKMIVDLQSFNDLLNMK